MHEANHHIRRTTNVPELMVGVHQMLSDGREALLIQIRFQPNGGYQALHRLQVGV